VKAQLLDGEDSPTRFPLDLGEFFNALRVEDQRFFTNCVRAGT